MTAGNVLAKALYDNLAETSDELEFHRGDIVTVLEQNTAGLEGWWLCSLNGRQGIAPGNRLRLMPLMQGIEQQQQHAALEKPMIDVEDEEYDIPTHQYINQNNNNNDPNEVYDVPVFRQFGSRPELDLDPEEVYDVPPSHATLHSSDIRNSSENLLTSSPQHRTVTIEQEVYDVPSNLIAPGNISNIASDYDPSEVYDVPPNRSLEPEEVYDVPVSNKMTGPEPLDVSAMLEQQEEDDEEEEYDVPPSRSYDTLGRSIISGFQSSTPSSAYRVESPDLIYDVPSSNRLADDTIDGSFNMSNLSPNRKFQPGDRSLVKQESEDYVYDVPPQVTRDQPPPTLKQSENEALDLVIKRLSLVGTTEYRNERRSTSSNDSLSSIIAANANYTELNLELSSAIDQLIKLKQSLEDSVSTLLTHVYEGWRLKENISGKIGVIKGVFEIVLSAVGQFVQFARGAMANANAAQQRGLTDRLPRSLITGIHKLLQPLEEDNLMLQQAFNTLNQAYWSLSKLVMDEPNFGVPDEMDSFVMTSRAVSDDARQMAAFIHTHSQYLFKKVETRPPTVFESYKAQQIIQMRPLPDLPPQKPQTPSIVSTKPDDDSWFEDYDYVALDDRTQDTPDGTMNRTKNVINEISKEVKTRHIEVLQVLEMSNKQHNLPTIINANTNKNNSVSNDEFTLQDLVDDLPILVDSLVVSIKRFYSSLDNNDPPKTFVALSKQVILSAHELVFFGDTLYRRLQHQQMQDIVKAHCTEICTSLKRTVAATKHAAQQWPDVDAVQEMVNRVTDISAAAHQFRILLSQCSVR